MLTPAERRSPHGLALASTLAVFLGGFAVVARAQQDKPPAPAGEPARPQLALPDLVNGLKQAPGCLGVETARTQSGKNVIFAWFENKQTVAAWYRSGTHRSVMKLMTTPGPTNPLKYVPDDAGPILVIASITLADKPRVEGTELPISQVSVEMYQPLPGGASAGGTFAPSALKIPHHQRLDSDEEAAEKPASGSPPEADAAKSRPAPATETPPTKR